MAGHELLHLVQDRVGVPHERHMVRLGELDIPRALDVVGDVADLSVQDDGIVPPLSAAMDGA